LAFAKAVIELGCIMNGVVTHPMDFVLRLLLSATVIGYFVLAVRLWQTGLARVYRAFFFYLLFRLARSLALSILPYDRNVYGYTWAATQPLLWFFYILIVLEVYSLVLRQYKGIIRLGRWVIISGLAIGLAISAATLPADFGAHSDGSATLKLFFVVDRGVVSSIVICLLIICVFLVWYPVPLTRNTMVHCVAYAFYFLSTTMAMLIRNVIGAEVNDSVNLMLSCISIVCLLVWIFFLNKQGEAARVSVRQKWAPEDETQIMEQLTAINSTLLRVARK